VDLSREVIALRKQAESDYRQLAEILTPRIEGHPITYRHVLDVLVEAHRRIADTMDFGFGRATRWAAIWEMSGRTIGLCNALLAQLRSGLASEVVPTLRAIHEAAQLLTVLVGPGEERILRQWLNDTTYINTAKARSAVARIERPIIALMKKQGITIEGDPTDLGAQIYDLQSKAAHNMRIGFAASVSLPLRTFSYGPHPDPRQRAIHVEYAGQVIEEVTLRVGSALATRFLGRTFYEDNDQAAAHLHQGDSRRNAHRSANCLGYPHSRVGRAGVTVMESFGYGCVPLRSPRELSERRRTHVLS
jgi:hypothetical protein